MPRKVVSRKRTKNQQAPVARFRNESAAEGPDSAGEELSAVMTPAVSMRVFHPLGWKFEVVGPKEIVDALWQQWLRFLHPELIIKHREDLDPEIAARIQRALSNVPPVSSTATAAPSQKLAGNTDGTPLVIGSASQARIVERAASRLRVRPRGPSFDWIQARAWYEKEGLTQKEIAVRLACHINSVDLHCRKEKWIKHQDQPQSHHPLQPAIPASAPFTRPDSTSVDVKLNRLCWNCGTSVPARPSCISCGASKTPGRFTDDR